MTGEVYGVDLSKDYALHEACWGKRLRPAVLRADGIELSAILANFWGGFLVLTRAEPSP
ncbi:hypothetical protein GCM10008965_45510 [Methylorubrum aminovorans]|nr:hypothetical protein GCM10025880_65640 [Methylorubrum aminovorans]GMA80222.1 hypothetical protein GCM10025880_66390 [Methylorubrum aminovorans]